MSWDDVYWDLCDLGGKLKAWGDSDIVWGTYLASLGFTRYTAPNLCPDCYTVSDFALDHPHGTYIVAPKEHTVAVINGNWYDSWDSGRKTVIFVWSKE